MKIAAFALERFQSVYEHRVPINLSESGVEPVPVRDLLGANDAAAAADFLDTPLGYSQTNGTAALRAAIAALYPGAAEDEVVVTAGSAEAIFVACWQLVEPGDEVVVMQPNYGQIAGLAAGFGATVRPWRLDETRDGDGRLLGWRADLTRLHALITPRTRLIAVCHPNNPTGARLTEAEVAAIAAVADRCGAWLLVDEIYRGAERDGRLAPTAWGRGERVIVTSGLSKAYGLPGLRIGWAVAPQPTADALWSRRDYTTIAPAALSDRLACLALAPARRAALIDRTRRLIADRYAVVDAWVRAQGPTVTCAPPDAGAIAFVRYGRAIGSTALAERLRDTEGVLVPPGDHFGMDGFLRIGFGTPADTLREGLARIGRVLATLPASPQVSPPASRPAPRPPTGPATRPPAPDPPAGA